jgi:CO dehydrogenase maturation factor
VRVAFVGKGGAGKSSVAGTVARLLARAGEQVLALDSDPMPGMALAVGVPDVDAGIPDEAVEEHEVDGRRRYRLRPGLTADEVVEQYAVHAPDGLRFLQLGKARGPRWENSRPHAAFQHVLDGLGDGRTVVGDLPAGTRQAFQGWGRYARTVVVVAEPTAASVLSARRLSRLAQMRTAPRVVVVASRTREPGDGELVAARTGLPLLGTVPFDPALQEAARAGLAPVDHAPDAPAVRAVASLVDRLREEEQAR